MTYLSGQISLKSPELLLGEFPILDLTHILDYGKTAVAML